MALIACSECGHQISDKAPSCPSCGAPQLKATQDDVLNGWRYRTRKDGVVEAIDPSNGKARVFPDWTSFWNLAHGQKPKQGTKAFGITVLSIVGVVILAFFIFGSANRPSAPPTTIAPRANAIGTGEDMVSNLGCRGVWSDDKKAAVFDRDYKDHLTTITGKVVKAGGGDVELAVLRSTLTYDVQINLKNPSDAYGLLKGQIVTIKFIPTTLGGCILPFNGDQGVIQQ